MSSSEGSPVRAGGMPPEQPSIPEGVSAFVAKVLDQLSLSAWLPAAFVTLSVTLLVGFRANKSLDLGPLVSYVNENPWTFALLAVPSIVCLTVITQAFSFEAIRLLEGYWRWPGPADWIRHALVIWHNWRRTRIEKRVGVLGGKAFFAARNQWLEVLGGNANVLAALQADAGGETRPDLSAEDDATAAEFDNWKIHCSPGRLRRIETLERALGDYPRRYRTLPTMLGNVIRTAEDDTDDDDIVSLVHRARASAPPRLLIQHDQFRTRMDMYAILTLASVLLAVCSGIALLPVANQETYTQFLSVSAAFLAVSWLSYRAAVASARGYVVAIKQLAPHARPALITPTPFASDADRKSELPATDESRRNPQGTETPA